MVYRAPTWLKLCTVVAVLNNIPFCHGEGGVGYSDTCDPLNPKVLVYSRTPKTASSALMHIVWGLSKRRNFTVISPKWYDKHDFRSAIDKALLEDRYTLVQSHNYMPWKLYVNRTDVAFMNFVRDPYKRCWSHFSYMHFGSHDRHAGDGGGGATPTQANRSMHQCMTNASCKFVCGRPMFQHFCADDECTVDDAARSLQLNNLVVGVQSNFLESAALLELKFPAFFTGLVRGLKHQTTSVNVGIDLEIPSKSEQHDFLHKVAFKNTSSTVNIGMDFDFYSAALIRFDHVAAACLSSAQHRR